MLSVTLTCRISLCLCKRESWKEIEAVRSRGAAERPNTPACELSEIGEYRGWIIIFNFFKTFFFVGGRDKVSIFVWNFHLQVWLKESVGSFQLRIFCDVWWCYLLSHQIIEWWGWRWIEKHTHTVFILQVVSEKSYNSRYWENVYLRTKNPQLNKKKIWKLHRPLLFPDGIK